MLPETRADKAGLQPGDQITAVNGKPVTTGTDLQEAVRSAEPGHEVVLTVARGEDTEKV